MKGWPGPASLSLSVWKLYFSPHHATCSTGWEEDREVSAELGRIILLTIMTTSLEVAQNNLRR